MVKKASFIFLWAALLIQTLVIPVFCEGLFENQKNFFFSDPNIGRSPPTVSYSPPVYSTPPTPPVYSTPAVPRSGGAPPAHCGTPPSGGGGHRLPSPPSSTPAPISLTPPTTPGGITTPSPPSVAPISPPFTCTYWRNHPTLIWAILGWWGSLGSAFGVTSIPGFGPQTSLIEALSNTRPDGYGELYREGTASLLNSMANTKFPYTTNHVRESFVAALSTNRAASAQAQIFNLANEGRIKPNI